MMAQGGGGGGVQFKGNGQENEQAETVSWESLPVHNEEWPDTPSETFMQPNNINTHLLQPPPPPPGMTGSGTFTNFPGRNWNGKQMVLLSSRHHVSV